MTEVGFIGDIHGCLEELQDVVTHALSQTSDLVFLGDYINRGRQSREVIEYLIHLQESDDASCTFILGNHDQAFINVIMSGKLDTFLRLGGAATITSYVETPTGDLLTQLREAVPREHTAFLQSLVPSLEREGVFATHDRSTLGTLQESDSSMFRIYGHSPRKGSVPTITSSEAFIDTGCGTVAGGRLTCLFWPSLTWIQSESREVPSRL